MPNRENILLNRYVPHMMRRRLANVEAGSLAKNPDQPHKDHQDP